jgi:hypothetical protein
VDFQMPFSAARSRRFHRIVSAAQTREPRRGPLSSMSRLSAGRFTGRLIGETTVAGLPAGVPTITGRAWVTGPGQYMLDPAAPYPTGIEF